MNQESREFEQFLKRAFEKYRADHPEIGLVHSDECPDPVTFAKFCGGKLDTAQRELVWEHIRECQGCLAAVSFYFKEIRPSEMAEPPEEIELLFNGEKRDIVVHWLLPGLKAKIPDVREVGDYEVRYGDLSVRFRCGEQDLFVGREGLKKYGKAADTEGGKKPRTIAGDQIAVTIHRGKARRDRPPSGAVFEIAIRRKE